MPPQEAKAKFRASGESASDWAKKHGFHPTDVYRVLNGRTACWRGAPHRIAVLLGIKPDPVKFRE